MIMQSSVKDQNPTKFAA